MLPEKETIRISKFLSLVLRHQPQTLGITLDESGWTDVATLLQRMQEKGFAIDQQVLQHVVDTNNKKRFAFSTDKKRIRASQGHSVNIELGYEPKTPPAVLYHGTASKNLPAIFSEGLRRGNRHHVHLSEDVATATAVGSRHGKPAVLQIDAKEMHTDGHLFFQSENGVWLTEAVPPRYLMHI